MPLHFKEAATNVLTNSVFDPAAKVPELMVCTAAIEAA
jgi:predicted molibdopterin-dependent oxidoreductase YjgC